MNMSYCPGCPDQPPMLGNSIHPDAVEAPCAEHARFYDEPTTGGYDDTDPETLDLSF